MNQEGPDPFDYFRDDTAPKKPEQTSSDDLVNNLRSDLLAASEVEPAKKSIIQEVNPKLIVGIFIGIVILGLILYSLMGPGRTILERKLASLKRMEATSTKQITPTQIPTTDIPVKPSGTPTKIPTVRPTNTVNPEIIVSPTKIQATTTPPSGAGCRDALTITVADVGQTLCVQGTIIETVTKPAYFMVIFNTKKGSFYWVTYDLVWSQAKLDTCYQTNGTINQIGISPMLVFSYSNLPEPCP